MAKKLDLSKRMSKSSKKSVSTPSNNGHTKSENKVIVNKKVEEKNYSNVYKPTVEVKSITRDHGNIPRQRFENRVKNPARFARKKK